MAKDIKERLLAKINKIDTCWLWTGGHDTYGYGLIKLNKKQIKTHRLSYTLFKGPIADKLIVRHLCHTPACINPEHLELGTMKDNVQDSILLGRHKNPIAPIGEQSPHSRFLDKDVMDMRWRFGTGEPTSSICKDYQLTAREVWGICRGRSWKHLPIICRPLGYIPSKGRIPNGGLWRGN